MRFSREGGERRISVIILCIILTGAALSDLRCRKVSNRWIFSGFFLEIILLGSGFLLPASLVFFPVYFLFRAGLMGAGDGKVIMLTAGSLGFVDGAWAVFFGFCLAALWSVIFILKEKSLCARLLRLLDMAGQIFRGETIAESEKEGLLSPGNTVPLAACLACGTILYVLVSGHFF